MIEVFPNPTSDILNIDFGSKKSGDIEIFNLSGVSIKNISIGYRNMNSISLKEISRGLFILSVNLNDGQNLRMKLI